MIGGSLSNPVPRLLGPGWTLFVNYPYLLPSIIAGSSGLLSFALGLALVPEVRPLTADLHGGRAVEHERFADVRKTLPPSLRRNRSQQRAGGLEVNLNDARPSDDSLELDYEVADRERLGKAERGGGGRSHADADASPGLWTLLKYKPFQNVLILYGCEYHARWLSGLSKRADPFSFERSAVLVRGGLSALCLYPARLGRPGPHGA